MSGDQRLAKKMNKRAEDMQDPRKTGVMNKSMAKNKPILLVAIGIKRKAKITKGKKS